jgi:hypothetical protein
MAGLVDIHEAIADRLNTIPGLRVAAGPPQGQMFPSAFVVLDEWEPSTMGRGTFKTYEFTVFVLTAQSARPLDGYNALVGFADSSGDQSVELAVWDGNNRPAGTFGGLAVTQAAVSRFELFGQQQVDAFEAYGGAFTITVQTQGA